MPRDDRPTLLVFTRGAERETRWRRLLPARLAPLELAVHRRCLAATLAAGREARCEITLSSPAPLPGRRGVRRLVQHGSGFGERLRDSLRRTQATSSGPVVVVGTDTPGLEASHLSTAVARLREDPDSVVLGPSPDGGIYLLATNRPLDRVLADIAWRHRETSALLVAALNAAGIRVTFLEPLADLDRPQDLARWASRVALDGWWWLTARVRDALAELRRLAVPTVLGRPRLATVALPSGRAPPRHRPSR